MPKKQLTERWQYMTFTIHPGVTGPTVSIKGAEHLTLEEYKDLTQQIDNLINRPSERLLNGWYHK